jgi:hypothetical protein
MSLISYVKTAMNKRLLISESHDDSNRCTPYRGKPDTHNTYTFHISPRMSLVRFLWVVSIRGNLSRWLNRVGQIHCSREKVLLTPPLSLAEWPTEPTSVSLPNTTIGAVHLSQTYIDEHATSVYWAHITSMWSVHSILAHERPTHRSLTDTGGGCNFGGVAFQHTTPRPSQPAVSTFHLKAPPGLKLSKTYQRF